MIAGYTAGAFGVLVGQPMDYLKVLAQTQAPPTHQSASLSDRPAIAASAHNNSIATNIGNSARSTLKVTATSSSANTQTSMKNMSTMALSHSQSANQCSLIVASSRIRALYAGIQGPLLLVGAVQSVNFAVYDNLRRWLYSHQQQQQFHGGKNGSYLHNDPLTNIVLAASATGALLSFLTSPFLIIKTRQQLCQQGFGEAVRAMWKQNLGFRRTFYVGFGPHFLTESLGRAAYFGIYETLKRELVSRQQEGGHLLTLGERMVCAGTAGVATWSMIFPFDALKSRMYASSIVSSRTTYVSTGSWQLAVSILREEQSLRPLYRGFGVTILRAGPVSAAVLPLYDTVLERLSSI